MANQVSNVNFMDPQGLEQQQLLRRKMMGEMLQKESLEPLQTQTAPGGWAVPIHPLQGAAKMLQAYVGSKTGSMADARAQALAQQGQERRGADLSLLAQALQGSPAVPGGQLQEDASGNVTPMDARPAMSPIQSLGQAIPMMGDPQMQMAGIQALQGAQSREDQQAFLAQQNQAKRDLSMQLADMRSRMNQDRSPYFQFLQTPTGFMAGNARTGQVSPVMHQGQQVMPAQIDPATQGNVAAAKAGGTERAQAQVQAQVDLPRVVNNARNALQLIDQMVGSEDGQVKAHPGFSQSVGLGHGAATQYIPGTNTANFRALLDQTKGGAFLEAFNSLKGGGQITEIEGKKATDAITRMRTAQSEAEFVKAAREYQNIIRMGVQRAQGKAGAPQEPVQPYAGPERRQGVVDFNSLKRGR